MLFLQDHKLKRVAGIAVILAMLHIGACKKNPSSPPDARIPTSVVLAIAPSPAVEGAEVSFTAVLTPAKDAGKPIGELRIMEGSVKLATLVPVDDVVWHESKTLMAGNHAISLEYTGDVNYQPSKSGMTMFKVMPAPPPPPPPNVLFSDDFESGNFSKWDYVGGYQCTPPCGVSINTDPAFIHSGTKSARMFYTIPGNQFDSHQDDNEFLSKVLNPPAAEVWVRGYVYFKSPEAGGSKNIQSGRKFNYLKSENVEAGGGWSCFLTSDSPGDDPNLIIPRIECNTLDGRVSFTDYSSGKIPFDEWHAVELHVKANNPGQNNGAFDVWLDGNSVLSRTAQNIRGNNSDGIKSIDIGMQSDRQERAVVKEYRFWDDIAISTKGRIGLR